VGFTRCGFLKFRMKWVQINLVWAKLWHCRLTIPTCFCLSSRQCCKVLLSRSCELSKYSPLKVSNPARDYCMLCSVRIRNLCNPKIEVCGFSESRIARQSPDCADIVCSLNHRIQVHNLEVLLPVAFIIEKLLCTRTESEW